MTDWNPTQYLSFARERALPALDLLSRVEGPAQTIVDLGCGPGNSTALLRARFPQAAITGIDASPAMIETAKANVPDATFLVEDVAHWRPPSDVDLVFSNALFQWVPGHGAVIRRLFAALRPGAVLALQMPDNLAEPSHRAMVDVAQMPEWRDRIGQAGQQRETILPPAGYHDLLADLSASVTLWQTRYIHALASHQAIADMLASTGLRPFLAPLTVAERAVYMEAYVQRLVEHYPRTADGKVLFAFPRLFVVAVSADRKEAR